MKIQEAKELYKKTIGDRKDPVYLKFIEHIKRAILNKESHLSVESIPQHVILLLEFDGYEVTFYSGFQREPDSYTISGWVN